FYFNRRPERARELFLERADLRRKTYFFKRRPPAARTKRRSFPAMSAICASGHMLHTFFYVARGQFVRQDIVKKLPLRAGIRNGEQQSRVAFRKFSLFKGEPHI